MISKYDLYDITYALILIRNDIYQSRNTAVLSQIIKALNDKDNDGENQIRMAISTVEGLNHDQWSFVYHNNFYVNHPLLKRAEMYDLLIDLLQGVACHLEKKNLSRRTIWLTVFTVCRKLLQIIIFLFRDQFGKPMRKVIAVNRVKTF